MKLNAHPMAADINHHTETVGSGVVIDCLGHIAQKAPGLNFLKAQLHALFRHVHQLFLLRRHIADAEHAGGVGKIPV